MTSSAFLLYSDESGSLRGTLIRRSGNILPLVMSESYGDDFERIVGYIELGRSFGGYRYPGDLEPLLMGDFTAQETELAEAFSADYIWELQKNGQLREVDLVEGRLISVEPEPEDPRAA